MNDKLEELISIINNAKYIVFFGGAGVSTESNLKDFRGEDGLYKETKYKHSPEEMLSLTFFNNHPKEFYEYFFGALVSLEAKPNDAHIVLAELEKKGKLKAIITQNIDGLHQMAGSKKVFELHGSTNKYYCLKCHKRYKKENIYGDEIPRCDCGGRIKPDVVLYEESLNEQLIEEAISHLVKADVLIVGGTSLLVYPAAGLIRFFNGDKLVLINKETTSYDEHASLIVNGKIGETLKKISERIL